VSLLTQPGDEIMSDQYDPLGIELLHANALEKFKEHQQKESGIEALQSLRDSYLWLVEQLFSLQTALAKRVDKTAIMKEILERFSNGLDAEQFDADEWGPTLEAIENIFKSY